MSFSVEVVADSTGEREVDDKKIPHPRLTTFRITFPRIILAEVNTHRMLSKNTASSRAIPYKKMVFALQENPFIPMAWQKDHSGMQGTEYFTATEDINELNSIWLDARNDAIRHANRLSDKGATKQLCNRLLEPFMWCTQLISGTDWENFFHLRCPRYKVGDFTYRSKMRIIKSYGFDHMKEKGDADTYWRSINSGKAEIHMMEIAEAMWNAYDRSTPKILKPGQWHIPFEPEALQSIIKTGSGIDWKDMNIDQQIEATTKVATTMAARTSYTVVGADQKELTGKRMTEIYDDLVGSDPLHASPLEHCAQQQESADYIGNFAGWKQLRKFIPNENATKYTGQ
jgi:hypothetical protein